MTHSEATQLVRGKTNRDRRKIGNNLWGFIRTDGAVAIMLHSTYIVILYPDGTAMVNSGGYRTHTTKKRINQFSPIKVYQKNWEDRKSTRLNSRHVSESRIPSSA